MQIGKILFPITTLGPGKRLGIWTQGCARFCNGCSNPELQIFDETKDVSVQKIFDGTIDMRFDGITISGGEPFVQPHELRQLVELYVNAGFDDILIYTGYMFEELVNKNNSDINYILANIAVLIDGPFIESFVDNVPLRGSSNQRVLVLNNKFKDSYENFLKQEKKVDIFYFEDETHFIGIPFKGYNELYKKLITIRRK
jgi:anaerobic ribonucleoside-triphosphate reductase activating protein